MKVLIAGAIAMKGIGGVLFIFGSSFGALLLVCSKLFYWLSYSFMCSVFVSYGFFFLFFAVAAASDDCYSNPL